MTGRAILRHRHARLRAACARHVRDHLDGTLRTDHRRGPARRAAIDGYTA